MYLDKAGETRLLQLNELNEFRIDAYENSVIYKERTKHWHDKHIRQRVFQVGDQCGGAHVSLYYLLFVYFFSHVVPPSLTLQASKVCHKERQVTRDDFSHHLLERVIQHCGWHKVADAPHAAYPTLVREFFANFNQDIGVPESSHIYKTWVRGRWIRFSPTMIDRYYGLTRTELVPLPSLHELDMALVARYLYGRDDAWPLATPRFMHDQFTRELRVLHIFVSSNINPTRKRTQFTEHRAILLHHLARLYKIDLGTHIFEFIRELAIAVDSQRTIHFSYLISGLCLTQGVSLFPTEEADPPSLLLNARSVKNSETKIAARGSKVHGAPAMNAGEDYLDDAAPVPPPALAAGSDLSIQLAQLMAAQTEMGRAIGTIQGTVLHIQ
ncbi:Uncharacterized protein Adt_45920 [Abeliophyllum distichum]|uniref:Putative plant transposon protein domain-containing protein n=1 Tax=Abeliophyllum distichum TaxID=126358 RepID=A0ABD1P3Q6_9LAMI